MTLPFTIIFIFVIAKTTATNEFQSDRAKIFHEEATMAVGGDIQLTDKEQTVNNCLMQFKFNEVDYAFDNPQYFNFSSRYFKYRAQITHSTVYKIIRDMPKGAALHVHDMALMGPDYLMNLTYMDHLYVCFDDSIQLLFADKVPTTHCLHKWQLMRDARHSAQNKTKFNSDLRQHFTMVTDDPDTKYADIKQTWKIFLSYFGAVEPLLSYRPVWEQYFYDALKRFKDENIMYVEVRSVLPNLYELDGTTYDAKITAKAYRKTIQRFMEDHPDFIGAKLIYAPLRLVNKTQIAEYLKLAKEIKADLGEVFAGFDLVGPEEWGGPLIEFVPQLQAASKDLDYFFHAGETDWYGTHADENIVDAILLGAKRLGHAYALPKHPVLLRMVKEQGIAVEVNVISNEVLCLVKDTRNHPLATLIAQGLPVVLSSDDPGVWEADVISHDFYVAFVGVASKLADLRLLKALAINSIKYSALKGSAKVAALSSFERRWNRFIDNFKCHNYV